MSRSKNPPEVRRVVATTRTDDKTDKNREARPSASHSRSESWLSPPGLDRASPRELRVTTSVVCDANGLNVKHQNTSGAFRHVLASAVCADNENTGITGDDEDRSGLRNGPFAAVAASSSSRSDESLIVDEKLGVCRVYTRRKARSHRWAARACENGYARWAFLTDPWPLQWRRRLATRLLSKLYRGERLDRARVFYRCVPPLDSRVCSCLEDKIIETNPDIVSRDRVRESNPTSRCPLDNLEKDRIRRSSVAMRQAVRWCSRASSQGSGISGECAAPPRDFSTRMWSSRHGSLPSSQRSRPSCVFLISCLLGDGTADRSQQL